MYNGSYADYNIAIGYYSLYNVLNGANNIGIGFRALYSNLADYNVAIGYYSMNSNTTGDKNVAIGYYTMTDNTTGYNNTAIGYAAYENGTNGYSNTAIGTNALATITSGAGNTAIGVDAAKSTTGYSNTALGISALANNTSGTRIVAIGDFTGGTEINNSYCTFIGSAASTNSVGPYNYSSAFGYSSTIDASYQVRIGNASTTSIGGYANWTNISDGRFKTNVQENVPGLDFIMALRPVTYNLDVAAINVFHHIPDSLVDKNGVAQKTNQIQTGFIAQEVEKVAQKLNYDFSGVDAPQNENSTYGLRYAEFVVPLVKAVQEQQSQIENLQKLVAEQNEMIKKLMQEK
jgi:hypothetical protein